MQLNAYLMFNGQCREAFKAYEKILGGKIVSMSTFGESPTADQTEPEVRDWIMHARMQVGDDVLMASDSPPQYKEGEMKGCQMAVGVTDPAEAERIFHALAEGGMVGLPIQETFWATRFGMLTDRFGVRWMVNCEKPGGGQG